MTFEEIPVYARRAYAAAYKRAKAANHPMLTKDEFCQIWERASGRCEISGILFSNDVEIYTPNTSLARKNSYPWQPSLDQIEVGLGYAMPNCQLVCKCVNIGKNSYTEETFERWVVATANRIKAKALR